MVDNYRDLLLTVMTGCFIFLAIMLTINYTPTDTIDLDLNFLSNNFLVYLYISIIFLPILILTSIFNNKITQKSESGYNIMFFDDKVFNVSNISRKTAIISSIIILSTIVMMFLTFFFK